MVDQRVFSASELDQIAGIQPAERRTLVRTGLLNPARTSAGWAVFGEDDVRKAREWKLQRATERRKARRA